MPIVWCAQWTKSRRKKTNNGETRLFLWHKTFAWHLQLSCTDLQNMYWQCAVWNLEFVGLHLHYFCMLLICAHIQRAYGWNKYTLKSVEFADTPKKSELCIASHLAKRKCLSVHLDETNMSSYCFVILFFSVWHSYRYKVATTNKKIFEDVVMWNQFPVTPIIIETMRTHI